MSGKKQCSFTLRALPHPSRPNCWKAVKSLPDGWTVNFEPPKRSKPQNAKLHALIDRLIKSGYEWYGKKLDKKQWKILFSAALFGQEVLPGIEGGFVACGYHTSEMSEDEASQMIELIYAFATERHIDLGPEIEDIEPQGRLIA